MDGTDKKILDMIKGNARMSYQEIGNKLGMSRVAAKKRIDRLEKAGIIRGYNTYIMSDDEIKVLIDIIALPGLFDEVLDYVCTKTAFIRQIYTTHKENHIHMVAVSYSVKDIKYLLETLNRVLDGKVSELHCRQIREVVKDVYGGIKYERKSESVTVEND